MEIHGLSHIHYYPPAFSSLVQVYARKLINSISVFLSAAAKKDAAAQLQRQKGGWIKWFEVREQAVNIYPKMSCVFPSEHAHTHGEERKVNTTAGIKLTK